MNSIYHTGELEIQHLAGQEAMAQHNQKIISPHIITGAFPFIEQQS